MIPSIILRCSDSTEKYEKTYLHVFLRTLDRGLHLRLWTPIFSIRYNERNTITEVPLVREHFSVTFQTQIIMELIETGKSGDLHLT